MLFRRIMPHVILILISMLAFMPAGCAGLSQQDVYRAYSGSEPPEIKPAELHLGSASWLIIDDMYFVDRRKYGVVKLPAGEHRIKWATSFGVSVMVDPRGYAVYETISRVPFEAGGNYHLKADRTTGQGYRVYMWVEDAVTGAVVDGKKKPQ